MVVGETDGNSKQKIKAVIRGVDKVVEQAG